MPRPSDRTSLREQLFSEILLARQRVYAVRGPTPLEQLDIGNQAEVWVKREDQPPIYAYKWRGAYNAIAALTEASRAKGVVCASAGNHSQGVALASARLNCHATIFMPRPTPMMKQNAVRQHGGKNVTVELVGDTFDQANVAAIEFAKQHDQPFVHPYDDLVTMGGQGTLADEVVMAGKEPFNMAYLQIGGGGMAAAVACWLRHYMPGIHIVGVEAEGQASMQLAIQNGRPTELSDLDIFCDGTAVSKAGELTFPLCRDLIDEFITVTNVEVCNAIRTFWNWRRRIVEPAGVVGLAGLLKHRDRINGKRVLAVTCGANMDFSKLAVIAGEAGIGGQPRHHLRFQLDERRGALLWLLRHALSDCNIIEFQYGKSDRQKAYPVIGFDAPAEMPLRVIERCAQVGIQAQDVTDQDDVQFRVLRYDPSVFCDPLMLRYEFPERAGALHEFLEHIQDLANICYFNYRYTGERVGRALVGLEFESNADREAMLERLENDATLRGRHQVLTSDATARMIRSE